MARHATPPLHEPPPAVAGNHQQAHIDAELVKLSNELQRTNKRCQGCQAPPCAEHHARALEAVRHDWGERAGVLEYDGGMTRAVAEVRAVVLTFDMYKVPHY
jgi:hypothetical protein